MSGEYQSDLLDACILTATPFKQASALFLSISSFLVVWQWCHGKRQTFRVEFLNLNLHFLLVTTKEVFTCVKAAHLLFP